MKDGRSQGYEDYFLLDEPQESGDDYLNGWYAAQEDREYHLGFFGDDDHDEDYLDDDEEDLEDAI